MGTDFVKMSPKGQLVVPQDIREQAGFFPGDRFMSVPVKEGVLFKKIDTSDLKKQFLSLSKGIEKQFKKQGVAKADVVEAVKWARRKSS